MTKDKLLISRDGAPAAACQRLWRENRTPFLSGLIAGLAAHGYAFSNKLLNHDEIESLFGKGATVTSGRWGLELVKLLFPDWSMPWIYGLLSLLLLSAAACLMLRVLEIRGTALRVVLPALVLTFPSLTGNFCFMFTSAAYAWSFFLAALCVFLFCRGGVKNALLSAALLVLALGIYQAYISVAATLFVLLMLRDTLDGERSVPEIIRFGVKALAMMLGAIVVYYGVTLLVFRVTGAEFNAYVTENVNGAVRFPRRVRMAYDNFLYIFSFRNFCLITSEASRYLHIALGLGTLAALGFLALRTKSVLRMALTGVLLLLLPLSICCMFLIMSRESIHTLVMYSFVCVYLLMGLTAQRLRGIGELSAGTLLSLPLSLVVLGNVYFANMCYLKLTLQYENARAFYTTLAARVEQAEGFDENCAIAIIGRQENLLHEFPELDTDLFMGVNRELVNIYSRENFIRFYLGLDLPFADEAETETLENDPRVLAMAEYPYDGSVQKIDDMIVVRLG